jgi:hypothetical protein
MVAVCLGLVPAIASAANPVVTITVSKWVVGLPSGFTLTYISEYEVQVDWVKGIGAENTMVRAAIGRPPTSITDGIEIYYGDGTTATSWINMETLSEPVYYRAWSETALGVWSPLYAEDQIEGVSMLLWILIFLALAFLALSIWKKKGYLAFAASGVWIVAGVYCFSRALENWDVYFSLGFLFMAFVLVCAFAPLAWRETTPANERAEEPDALVEGLREEMGASDSERGQFDFLYKNRRPTKRKMSRYEMTGRR